MFKIKKKYTLRVNFDINLSNSGQFILQLYKIADKTDIIIKKITTEMFGAINIVFKCEPKNLPVLIAEIVNAVPHIQITCISPYSKYGF